MRTRFDRFAKAVSQHLLQGFGEVQIQEEVAGTVQHVDTLFTPKPVPPAKRARLGLFGRIAESYCMLEFFHKPPGRGEIEDCIGKQHQLSSRHAREARSAKKTRPPLPQLWILSAGKPKTVINRYELRPMEDWPPGCLKACEGLNLGLMVLSQLPEERDTLCLRLMGAGQTFIRAVKELASLPPDAWEREEIVPLLLAYKLDPQSHFTSNELDQDAMAYMHDLQAIYADWEAKTLEKGREDGRKGGLRDGRQEGLRDGLKDGRRQGKQGLLVTLLTLKFGPLDKATVARLEAASDTELDRWAERVLTAETLAAVFAER